MIYKQNHRRTRWFPLRIETIKSMVKKANLILSSRILKNLNLDRQSPIAPYVGFIQIYYLYCSKSKVYGK